MGGQYLIAFLILPLPHPVDFQRLDAIPFDDGDEGRNPLGEFDHRSFPGEEIRRKSGAAAGKRNDSPERRCPA